MKCLHRARFILLTLLLLPAMGAAIAQTPVVVIHGHDTVPAGERGFARSLGRHAQRMFREAGLDVDLHDDTRLTETLKDRRVAVLVYLAQMPAAQLETLKSFVTRGGRLIVCYSATPGLADFMGVELGSYVRGSTDGRWAEMTFGTSRPRGVPERIAQSSPNLMLAQPRPGESEVLAWWSDRRGRASPEPAWLVTRKGYWMTHVLLADGDAEAKGRLLLALAASCDPSLWKRAAGVMLSAARQAGTGAVPSEAEAAALRVKDAHRRDQAVAEARQVVSLEMRARDALRRGEGFQAWQAAQALRAAMNRMYGLLQTPRRGEVRMLWEHSGMGLYPGDWARTCRVVKDAGFTDILVNVAGAGFAHYHSQVLPNSRVAAEQGDQLAACITAAQPLGLRVHAWLICFSATQTTPERMGVFRRNGWLLANEDGRERPWLDPSSSDVRKYLTDAAGELATRYPVDGVHLDFIRYPDFASSLGSASRQRFERDIGRAVVSWPAEVRPGGARSAEFMRWRTAQVSDFMAAVRVRLRSEAPGKLLTAAVFGKYPSCVDAVGQDWHAWVEHGWVDYVLPMNYTENNALFSQWVGEQTTKRALQRRVLPGLGVTAAESRLTPAQVIDQIQIVRRSGAPGFALFDLDATLEKQIFPVLRLGVTAP